MNSLVSIAAFSAARRCSLRRLCRALAVALLSALAQPVKAAEPPEAVSPAPADSPATADAADLLPALSVHSQLTFVDQGNFRFRSPYAGPNSLNPGNRQFETMSATEFIGWRPWGGSEIYFNPELDQGFGLGHTTGLGGFPNGEAQKAGSHVPRLNIARLYLKQVFGLGGEQEDIADDANQVAGRADVSRITVYLGKLAVNDLFDNNAFAHDARNDFLNWSVWEGGAYDYAADQKGYSDGLALELNQKDWAFRVADFLVPRTSNSRDLAPQVLKRGGFQAELEERHALFGRDGKLRLLGFANRAYAGSYGEALRTPGVDISLTRKDRLLTGLVVNLEQSIAQDVGVFARFSYNDGHSEIMSFTDISRSGQLGLRLAGGPWGRPQDMLGLAGVVNALSTVQIAYFAAGGTGILIGDGRLNYATEKLLELFYRTQLTPASSLSADYQFVANPAYNQDRGPVSILAARLHFQF
ncbi:MAG: carbohydrate porin [Alphaproteobacteria bacterium]|nr:carbohydrate porin [Alphaproteobacteria bacterium]